MEIQSCSLADADEILSLYQHARSIQTEKKMVVWPMFSKTFVEQEIAENRQWKILVNNDIACNWAITFIDKEIWEHRDRGDAIYIHRIATNARYRGNRFIDKIVTWAKLYAHENGKKFIRLDTLGNNTKLIEHYTSAGFRFLGMFTLTNTANLPAHYQHEPNCCLFEMELAGQKNTADT